MRFGRSVVPPVLLKFPLSVARQRRTGLPLAERRYLPSTGDLFPQRPARATAFPGPNGNSYTGVSTSR